MNFKKLINEAFYYDKQLNFKKADKITNILLKKAQLEQKIQIREGLDFNDPKSIEDYFLGYVFSLFQNDLNISKNKMNIELKKMFEDKRLNLSENDVKQLNQIEEIVFSKLETLDWYKKLPEFEQKIMPYEDFDSGENNFTSKSPNEFIEKLSGAAQQASSKFENIVPASFIIALAAWESGWGKSKLASQYGNFFGIKQSPSSGSQSGVSMQTFEFDGGKHKETADFAIFGSDAVSAMSALPNFLRNNPRYYNALNYGQEYRNTKSKNDLFNMIDAVFSAGYSTDPDEPRNIKNLIEKYNLTKYD